MKRGSTVFLKVVIILIAIGTLVGLLWEPHIEGRNVHADLVAIYFHDPFLAYTYIASIPFFAGLYQAFKLLGYIEHNKAFFPVSVKALRNMKYCALALIGSISVAILYIFVMSKITHDDPAGFIAIGLVVVFASAVIATAAAVFERLLQNAVDIKSENDLTV